MKASFVTLLTTATLVLGACARAPTPSDSGTKLEPYECGTVQRIHTLDGVFLASQPSKEDFGHARDGGIKTVINLRKADELEWDEASVVEELGMEYHGFPFRAASEMTDELIDGVRELLNDKQKGPLLLHCASANRVGALWLAHRVLDGGLSFEEANAEAEVVGLKMPAYTDRVKEYVAARQKTSGAGTSS